MREVWWVAADVAESLDARGLTSVAACMEVARDHEVLSSDRQSAAVRIGGRPCLLLKWRRPRPGRRWKTLFRASRERREAWAFFRAKARGLEVPLPLAVAERRSGPRLVGSVLIRPYVEGAVPGDRHLQESGASADAASKLTQALAAWHDLGLRHGDCYPKNVIVGADGVVAPIGLPAARFTERGPTIDRHRLKDLAQWLVGLSELGVADPRAFLDVYATRAGLSDGDALADRIQPFLGRIQARKARRRATQPRREPHGAPAPVPLPTDRRPPARRRHPIDALSLRGP